MQKSRYRRALFGAAAAIPVLSAATGGPALARAGDPSMPCPAFSRTASGGWTVLAPVMIDLGGRLYSPTVGTTLAAGSLRDGIEMSDVLDRECGNR